MSHSRVTPREWRFHNGIAAPARIRACASLNFTVNLRGQDPDGDPIGFVPDREAILFLYQSRTTVAVPPRQVFQRVGADRRPESGDFGPGSRFSRRICSGDPTVSHGVLPVLNSNGAVGDSVCSEHHIACGIDVCNRRPHMLVNSEAAVDDAYSSSGRKLDSGQNAGGSQNQIRGKGGAVQRTMFFCTAETFTSPTRRTPAPVTNSAIRSPAANPSRFSCGTSFDANNVVTIPRTKVRLPLRIR